MRVVHSTCPKTLASIQYHIDGHTMTLARPWQKGSVLQASHIAELDGMKAHAGELIPEWAGRILGIFAERGVNQ